MKTNDSDDARVADAMTSPVLTVDPETRIGEVARLLVDNQLSGLPVVDVLGHVLGVITEADLLPKEEDSPLNAPGRFESPQGRKLRAKREAVTARQAMTPRAISVDPACTLRNAARIMDSRRIRRLVVVDEDKGLVGVISRRDIVREFTRDDLELHDEVIERLRERVGVAGLRVRVSVQDGTVDLRGVVRTHDDLKRVRSVAAATRGVLSIRDSVEVENGRAAALRAVISGGSD
ncbi:MAG TPA: CBS domain-containing protein [Candidatus Dormibacteraeota bacterium]|nr:CBS domain-containing protein [Candidatus Dormibacteraeota bacterium]